jgi:hypothetical protein
MDQKSACETLEFLVNPYPTTNTSTYIFGGSPRVSVSPGIALCYPRAKEALVSLPARVQKRQDQDMKLFWADLGIKDKSNIDHVGKRSRPIIGRGRDTGAGSGCPSVYSTPR